MLDIQGFPIKFSVLGILLILGKLAGEGAQSTLFYGLTQTLHEPLVEVQIVDGIELGTQYFLAFIEVVQVGPTEVPTGVAAAILIQCRGILTIAGITQTQ